MATDIVSILQIASALGFVSASVIDDGLFWYNAEHERAIMNDVKTVFKQHLELGCLS